MSISLLIALGLLAGALTTITGVGGGILLLIALALLLDPATALAITAPGLLAGNLHRLLLFRRYLRWGLATRLIAGALPGALVGGLVATQLPDLVLRVLLLGATGLALCKAFGWLRFQPREGWVLPVGAVAGVITAMGGGGGVLVPPTLLTLGLRGPAYLATAAAASAAMHIGRLSAYGLSGWMNTERWHLAAVLALAIPTGNLLGRALGARLNERTVHIFTHATLLVVTLLAVAGLR